MLRLAVAFNLDPALFLPPVLLDPEPSHDLDLPPKPPNHRHQPLRDTHHAREHPKRENDAGRKKHEGNGEGLARELAEREKTRGEKEAERGGRERPLCRADGEGRLDAEVPVERAQGGREAVLVEAGRTSQ